MRDLDGSKVLVKLAENPFAFAKRCRPFFGGTDSATTPSQSDVRAMERRRQMGDIGIVAQRYELVLFGSHQRLELQPWQPETQRTVKSATFAWTKDAWYTMKLEVQNMGGGKVRARGKVWPKGETEPAAWTIERIDPIGSAKGAAGLYADAPSAGRRRVGDVLRQHQGVREQEVSRDQGSRSALGSRPEGRSKLTRTRAIALQPARA